RRRDGGQALRGTAGALHPRCLGPLRGGGLGAGVPLTFRAAVDAVSRRCYRATRRPDHANPPHHAPGRRPREARHDGDLLRRVPGRVPDRAHPDAGALPDAAGVTTDEFVRLRWRVTHVDPVLRPPALSPIIADPTFLLAHETPDGRWHLVAHSIWGLH